MKKEITTKTTIRLSIKGVDHDLTPKEAKAIIEQLREATNEKPTTVIREIERHRPRQRHRYPNPPFGWPTFIGKLGASVRSEDRQVITGAWSQ